MKIIILFFLGLTSLGVAQEIKDSIPTPEILIIKGLSNQNITPETKALFIKLKNIPSNQFLFGYQHAFAYGQKGKFKVNDTLQSDCFNLVEDHPAIVGFDLERKYEDFIPSMIQFHKLGGVISLSWHTKNPATKGGVYDTKGNPVQEILAEKEAWNIYRDQLDKIGDFMNNLTYNGVKIPLIFRPFHEHNGSWFWWGEKFCTPDEYNALWKKTIDYLRDVKKVNNMLVAFSPGKPHRRFNEVQKRYPGDGYVDILGFDTYEINAKLLQLSIINDIEVMGKWANETHKVFGITEFGISNGLQNTLYKSFFTKTVLKAILKNHKKYPVSFAVTWTNPTKDKYWIPQDNQRNVKDFKKFYKSKHPIFLKEISN